MGDETPSQSPLEKTLSTFLDESPRYLKSLREPFEGKSIQVILFTSPSDAGQKISIDTFYPFQTIQEIKTKIYGILGTPQSHPYLQSLLVPLDDETQLNTEYVPSDFIWTTTNQKIILTNPFRRIAQGVDQRFISSSGQRKVVGFSDHSRMTIEDIILKIREKPIFTFHLFLYKDIERLIRSPRPLSELDWFGLIYPYFPSLSPELRGELTDEQKAEIEAYTTYNEKTEVLIELYDLLLTEKEQKLVQLKVAGIRYMRLVWTEPPEPDRRSLENLFYEIPATSVRPFLRFLPADGIPVTKIKIKSSIKTPDISDPKLLFQWAEERNPTPDNDFLLVKSMIRSTQGSTPAYYGTLRLYQDSTADYILQPPKMLRKFDPRSDLSDFSKYLEETVADTYLHNRSPEIGEATINCGIRISRDEPILKREDLRKRVHVMSPFFQEITALPGEQPLLMLRYKAVSNFATEDRINVFLTQLARRRLQEGVIEPKAYVDDIMHQFQLNRHDAERRVDAWFRRSSEMTATSSETKDYTSMYNKGIDIAIFAQHPFYSFHIYGIDSILVFRRVLTLLSILLSSKNDELYAPESILQSIAAADLQIQGQESAKEKEQSQGQAEAPESAAEVPDWATDLMFDPFSEEVHGTENAAAEAPAAPLQERVREEQQTPSQELSQAIQAPAVKKIGAPAQEETAEEEAQRKKTFANYFLRKLQEADRRLFDYNKTHPSVKQYATMCQANDTRQPIVMSQEQYDAMLEVYGEERFVRHGYDPKTKEPFEDEAPDAGEYVNVLVYGSDTLRINYYICSNLFCIRDYIVVFEEDYVSTFDYEGKPKASKSCPFCHGVEIRNIKNPGKNETIFQKKIKPKTENKKHLYIGFLKKKSHPEEGLFLPCCFLEPQSTINPSGEAFQPFQLTKKKDAAPAVQASAQPFLDYEITLRRAYKKYILGPEKFPLEMNDREGPQVGLLPQVLDVFFDQNPINMVSRDFNRMELKLNSRGFLRIGVENQQRYQNDSFLAALAPYMMPHVNTIEDVKQEIKKVITPRIFIHLNYGNLLLEFYKADYPIPEDLNLRDWALYKGGMDAQLDWKPTNEEYILRIYKSYHNFLDYLEQSTQKKEYRHFAQLLADESLLTPRGIVFMILDISEKNEVSVRCPPYGYDIEKHDKCDIGILLHDWRGIWEPIFYVENTATPTQREEHKSEIRFQQALESDWSYILRKRVNEFRTRCATTGKAMFTSQQGIDHNAILSPYQVVTRLGRKANLIGIVKDAYNHSVAITVRLPKNRNLISIPIVDDGNLRYTGLKIHLDWDDFTPAPADDIYNFYTNVVNAELPNYPGYQILRKVTSRGEGGQLKAFQLRNGIYIPVGQPNSETAIASLPTVSENEREWIINKQIYFEDKDQGNRQEQLLLAEQRDMDEIYQHLRYTFGNWISSTADEDLRGRVQKIIFRKDLPLFEKRKRLFILLNKDISSWFDTDEYKREETTSLLRADCILRAETNCNGRCVWRPSMGKCLLHSPKEMSVGGRKVNSVQLFVFRILDELLRFPEKRKQLLENEVSALVTLKDAVIIGKEKDQYIVPENSSAWFNLLRMDWTLEKKEQPLFFEEMSGEQPTGAPPPRIIVAAEAPPPPAPAQGKPRVFKVAAPARQVAAAVEAAAAVEEPATVEAAAAVEEPAAVEAAAAVEEPAAVASAPLVSAPLASAKSNSALFEFNNSDSESNEEEKEPEPEPERSRVFKVASASAPLTSASVPLLLPEVSLPLASTVEPTRSRVFKVALAKSAQVPEAPVPEAPVPAPVASAPVASAPVASEPLAQATARAIEESISQKPRHRVFKVVQTAPVQTAPVQTAPSSKTVMTVAKTLANLDTANIKLEDTVGSMDGDRQKYDISFPLEEEELAKLNSQFKTLRIRPNGLSAVPGTDFEENQQTLARLMREAEIGKEAVPEEEEAVPEEEAEAEAEEAEEGGEVEADEVLELPTCQDCKENKVTGPGMKYCERCK